jgi:hypothetical protein
VARSDVSGEEIPPGQVRSARLTIGDETREVKLSADEASRALDEGQESNRWIRLLRKWGPRVLGGFLALLLIPAITGQWADRSKEVEVQRDLVTQMSETAATAIGTMRIVGQNLLPEVQLADRLRAEGRATPATDRSEARAEAKATNKAISAWETASGRIAAELGAYFHDSDVSEDWRRYALAVRNYQRVASSICGVERVDLVAAIRAYLYNSEFAAGDLEALRSFAAQLQQSALPASTRPKPPPPPTADDRNALYTKAELEGSREVAAGRFRGELPSDDAKLSAMWKDLIVDQGPGCQGKGGRFRNAYGLLSNLLVARQDAVLQRVPHEDVAGLSTGVGDLLQRLSFQE